MDPKSEIPTIPMNGLSYDRAFERLFTAVQPDAIELASTIESALKDLESSPEDESVRDRYEDAVARWDAARREVDEFFRGELAYEALVGMIGDKQVDLGYWLTPAMLPGSEGGIFFWQVEFESWLERVCGEGKMSNRGRKPEYRWLDVRAFVFDKMNYHGDFLPEDPEWNCQAKLEEAVAAFMAENFRHPGKTQINEYVHKCCDEWRTSKGR